MNKFDLWQKWNEVHGIPDQQKRLKSGKDASCTPVNFDSDGLSGTFKGSSGTYTTSLEKCNCMDFSRRHKPCKHMYRLALEVGIITDTFSTEKQKIVTPVNEQIPLKQWIATVEALPINTQKLLHIILDNITIKKMSCSFANKGVELECLISLNIVYESLDLKSILLGYKRNDLNMRISGLEIPFKKNMSQESLVGWCLENINDQILTMCPEMTSVSLCSAFSIHKQNMYRYLNRKFGLLSFDDIPKSNLKIIFPLPDDKVTEYLIEYGYYEK